MVYYKCLFHKRATSHICVLEKCVSGYIIVFCCISLAFSDKVIRVIPGNSNEVEFLSSLEVKQELEVRL